MSEPSWVPESVASTIEENWLFRLRRERFRSLASGRSHEYYVIELADAVNIIAVTPDRRVLLVRQFRGGSGRDSLETPGGLVEPGEDPLVGAARELLEETGHAGDPPQSLGTVWSNPSLLTSRMTTVLIENACPVGATAFDDHEELTIEFVPESEILAMIGDGRIDHALVVLGLFSWIVRREGRGG